MASDSDALIVARPTQADARGPTGRWRSQQDAPNNDVSVLLDAWSRGETDALDRLMDVVLPGRDVSLALRPLVLRQVPAAPAARASGS